MKCKDEITKIVSLLKEREMFLCRRIQTKTFLGVARSVAKRLDHKARSFSYYSDILFITKTCHANNWTSRIGAVIFHLQQYKNMSSKTQADRHTDRKGEGKEKRYSDNLIAM